MGMFDRVMFECPRKKCDGEIEFQSKAGACHMLNYDGDLHDDTIPPPIAYDLNDDVAYCDKCRKPVVFKSKIRVEAKIIKKKKWEV